MVSPKINHGKSEKIISKVTRRVSEMRSYPKSGNEKAQPPMMRSKQRVGANIEQNARVSRPRKVGEISTSKNFIGETGNERDQFHVMRSNQWTDLEAIQHRPGQSIEVNGIISRPRKVGQVPTLKNSVAQVDNKRDQLPNMRSNPGTGLEAIHQSINVQDMWYRRNNLFSDQAATLNNVHGFEATYHDPSQNMENSSLLPSLRKDLHDTRGCHESLFSIQAETSKNTNDPQMLKVLRFHDVDIIGCSKPRKKRGKTKGVELAKTLKRGNKFEILFPRHVNRAVGEHSNMFTTEIGVLVRQIAPLQAVSWVSINHEIKDTIMSRLRDKFVFSEEDRVIESVKHSMARRYNTWRFNLHDKFLEHRTIVSALSNPPECIKKAYWMYLCDLFTTPKFKARSERNKKNKAKLRNPHIARTKAFSKIRYDKGNRDTQKELEFDELYQSTHQKDDGTWVNETAKDFYENLKKHKTNAASESISLTDKELSVLTFGRKAGYVCGLGYGPKTTTSIKGKRTRADLEREAHEAVKRADVAERKNAAMTERLELMEAQQADFSAKLKEEMNSQLASIRQELLGRQMFP